MANYPYLVNIAWDTVQKFIKDWQREPYRWPMERDVQVELASRISSVYKIIGRDTVRGNYSDAIPGFEHNQNWNRVSCEHTLSYIYKDGKRYRCHPDIIIWDDIDNPDSPPDAAGDRNWPMLWLCEIKLRGDEEESWDIEKMKYLLTQRDTKYACWLNLFLERVKTGDGISWDKPDKNEKLWICTAKLPALK